jgi:hypothetical protein
MLQIMPTKFTASGVFLLNPVHIQKLVRLIPLMLPDGRQVYVMSSPVTVVAPANRQQVYPVAMWGPPAPEEMVVGHEEEVLPCPQALPQAQSVYHPVNSPIHPLSPGGLSVKSPLHKTKRPPALASHKKAKLPLKKCWPALCSVENLNSVTVSYDGTNLMHAKLSADKRLLGDLVSPGLSLSGPKKPRKRRGRPKSSATKSGKATSSSAPPPPPSSLVNPPSSTTLEPTTTADAATKSTDIQQPVSTESAGTNGSAVTPKSGVALSEVATKPAVKSK